MSSIPSKPGQGRVRVKSIVKRNKSIKVDPEMAQMLKLLDRYICLATYNRVIPQNPL